MAKRKSAPRLTKTSSRVKAVTAKTKSTVQRAGKKLAAVAKWVVKNMAARRARRQAAIVNALAEGTTIAKKMKARAVRKAAAAAKAQRERKRA
jgi:hypothetical protein